MRTLVIGDIHGHVHHIRKLLALDDTRVIFVGDFLDSFRQPIADQIECISSVIEAVEQTREGKRPNNPVLSCIGNHERSYLYNAPCSGWNAITQKMVAPLADRAKAALQDYIWLDFENAPSILISHAGVSALNWDKPPETITHSDVEGFLASDSIYHIGKYRGGPNQVGGIFWCDWWAEFEPIPILPQIVGHSCARPRDSYKGAVASGNSYNIDCLQYGTECAEIALDGTISITTF